MLENPMFWDQGWFYNNDENEIDEDTVVTVCSICGADIYADNTFYYKTDDDTDYCEECYYAYLDEFGNDELERLEEERKFVKYKGYEVL